jgi:hypothetical protein
MEPLIKPAFLRAKSDHGISAAGFLSVTEKDAEQKGLSGLIGRIQRPFPASGHTTPLAGPTACGVGRD